MTTVVVIHAHPDDETFANAAAIRQAADAGHRVVAVIATAGEKSEFPSTGTLAEARTVRLAKFERALAHLGVARWQWLDSTMPWADADDTGRKVADDTTAELRRHVEKTIGQVGAHTIYTVGMDGLTGHPDHVAIGQAVAAATAHCEIPGGVWGARLPRSAVLDARHHLAAHAGHRATGSGRVQGTDAALVETHHNGTEAARRAALDIYAPGLGSTPLSRMVTAAPRIGDSLLLRAMFDANGWNTDWYQRYNSVTVQ